MSGRLRDIWPVALLASTYWLAGVLCTPARAAEPPVAVPPAEEGERAPEAAPDPQETGREQEPPEQPPPEAEPDQAGDAADEEQRRAVDEKARARAAELFYNVRTTFQVLHPSTVRELGQHYGYGQANNLGMRMSLDRRTLTLEVVLVDPAGGLFVMGDPHINFDSVATLELQDGSGKTYPVEIAAVKAHGPGIMLRAKGFSVDAAPVEFNPGAIREDATMLIARATTFGRYDDVQIQRHRLSRFLNGSDGFTMFNLGGLPANVRQNWPMVTWLLFDDEGEPVAVATSSLLVRTGGDVNCVTGGLGGGGWVTAHEMKESQRRALRNGHEYTRRIRFIFRRQGAGGQQGKAGGSESIGYGLIVDERHLFIPSDMARLRIESIEAVKVQLMDGHEVAGAFAGLYEEFGGVLVRSSRDMPVLSGLWEPRDVADHDLFFDMTVKQRFGRKDLVSKYNRFFGTEQGYKDKEFRRPTRPVLSGSFLLDSSGRFYGFAAYEKRHENILKTDPLDRNAKPNLRCYLFADMKDRFLDPEEYFDAQVRVKDVQEGKKLVWLGVEFQPVTPLLARQLDVEEETRDGRNGLLVTLVYPGSPAERMDIQPGDVLLKIQEVGKAGEYVLRLSGNYKGRNLAGNDAGPVAYVDRRWFDRANPLTNLLTTMGAGAEVDLTYTHDGAALTGRFALEMAPLDLRSAEKCKNEWTGLTVKDITYEVRHLLRLPGDSSGVVVYEVEPGSPAAVGRVMPMEFIQEVEGRQVADIDGFRALIEGLVTEGRKSVTIKVRNLDRSRFVEVQLEEPDESAPAGATD